MINSNLFLSVCSPVELTTGVHIVKYVISWVWKNHIMVVIDVIFLRHHCFVDVRLFFVDSATYLLTLKTEQLLIVERIVVSAFAYRWRLLASLFAVTNLLHFYINGWASIGQAILVTWCMTSNVPVRWHWRLLLAKAVMVGTRVGTRTTHTERSAKYTIYLTEATVICHGDLVRTM